MPNDSSSGFSLDQAMDALRSYRLSTGIECYLIDQQGQLIGHGSEQHLKCHYCRTLTHLTGRVTDCQQVHLYGSSQAQQFGGKYMYFCPLSLLHLSSPIIIDGIVRASLVAGPVMLVDPQDYYVTEIKNVYELDGDKLGKLKQSMERIPYVSTARAKALLEQLLFTASWISGINVQQLMEEQAQLSQQSRINDYIQGLQTMGSGAGESYPLELENQLMEYISQGNREGSQELLNQFLARLHVSTGSDLGVMKARTLELVVLLSRAAIQGGAAPEHVFGLNFQALKEIHSFKRVDQLDYWLKKMVVRFNTFVFDVQVAHNRDVILKAVHYIQSHFKEKIELQDVADHVYLSPAYFSRLFKEKTGDTFKSYLNKVRIQQSKNLLLNTKESLVEIGATLGFEEQSYFTRVFKSIVGVSPGKYRQTKGSISFKDREIH